MEHSVNDMGIKLTIWKTCQNKLKVDSLFFPKRLENIKILDIQRGQGFFNYDSKSRNFKRWIIFDNLKIILFFLTTTAISKFKGEQENTI